MQPHVSCSPTKTVTRGETKATPNAEEATLFVVDKPLPSRRLSFGSLTKLRNAPVVCEQCMSFVPAPQQANAAVPAVKNTTNAAAAAAEPDNQELVFKIRTFDVFWVEKKALMYKDGYAKVCLDR